MLLYLNTTVKPDFLVWTGDNISSNFWDHTLETTIQDITKISQLVNDYLGSITAIFPAIGNHDIFPLN
jgi:hypothetical protein